MKPNIHPNYQEIAGHLSGSAFPDPIHHGPAFACESVLGLPSFLHKWFFFFFAYLLG